MNLKRIKQIPCKFPSHIYIKDDKNVVERVGDWRHIQEECPILFILKDREQLDFLEKSNPIVIVLRFLYGLKIIGKTFWKK